MNSVEDLDVFKLAHELALKIYLLAKKFSREEIRNGFQVTSEKLATPHGARQGRVKTSGPMNDSALERVSSESIPSERALGLSGTSP